MHHRTTCRWFVVFVALFTTSVVDAQIWLDYDDVTGSNIVADPFLATNDPEEKDYAHGDFDLDGDIDLVVARKLPFTTFGDRPNVLFMNVDGVMIDMTGTFAPEFISSTQFPNGDNARDVMIANINGDIWPDLVFANAGNQASPGQQPRLYINLGENGSGDWLGFDEESFRLPFLVAGADQPNACAVGVGDVTGNGVDDLYIVDYLNTLEDKLLINDGSGFFTEETDARLPAGFETSAFATAGMIADLNGDGYAEIIKNSTPSITVAYNNGASNPGVFGSSQALSVSAAYHFDIGDLNGDGMLDFFVVQDGQDQWQLNGSGVGANPITWNATGLTTSPLTTGFGGNAHIVDLDGDADPDIIVTDADTDVPACPATRRLAFLRNDGGNFADPYTAGTYLPAHHNGVFDVAAADFNNDGGIDLWIGHCDGTNLYFSTTAVLVQPVDPLTCAANSGDVDLTWVNDGPYDSLRVNRDGVTIATLGGSATSHTDPNPGSGVYSYSVIATAGGIDSPAQSCVVTVSNVNPVTGLTCTQIEEDVQLDWTNNGGVFSADYDGLDVSRNGIVIATLPGTATSYLDLAPTPGSTTYVVTALIAGESSEPTACNTTVFNLNVSDLVLRYDDTLAGDTDSSQAIFDALIANSQVPVLIDIADIADLAGQGIDMASFPRVWCEVGTFPNGHTLTSNEGQALADYVNAGGSVYLSGGDTHCFNAATPIHALTGVSDSCSDGGGLVDDATGIVSPSCDLGEFELTVPYTGESGFIDRLSPLTTGEQVLSFTSGGVDYSGGVYNQVGSSVVIAHSLELGGIGEAHDQEDLVSRYLFCIAPPAGPQFIRGDVNQDGSLDVSDVIATLDHLFLGLLQTDCPSTMDSNDDGSANLADAVFSLAFLFTFGADPAAPFPTCGEEATPDALTCDSYPCP